MKSFLIFLITSSLAPQVLATEDHGVGKISTAELDLTYIDHVLTGRVGDRPVFAKPLEGEFGLYLWHRAEGTDFESTLRVVDEEVMGQVASASRSGVELEKEFRITKVSPDVGTIEGQLGDRQFTVQVSADEMDGHHYVEPNFLITYSDSTTYEFHLEGANACMGCAIKLSYAIISMLHFYETE